MSLFQLALTLGKQRGHFSRNTWNENRRALTATSSQVERTIASALDPAKHLAGTCSDATNFVFCGAGPNYGAALFSAAKFIEATGDQATGQDLEEWAHLQYFNEEAKTPTFILSAGGWDKDRAIEIVEAANQIGRRTIVIAPEGSDLSAKVKEEFFFGLPSGTLERFTPLLTCIPAAIFAANHAELLNRPYFRDFKGGRSLEGGGGISRIQTSNRLSQLPH